MTDSNHVIRLHGPWQVRFTQNDSLQKIRCQFPVTTDHVPSDANQVILERHFGRPTGVSDDQDLYLVFGKAVGNIFCTLNDDERVSLNAELTELKVTERLEARNRLQLIWEPSANSEAEDTLARPILESISLEIRAVNQPE